MNTSVIIFLIGNFPSLALAPFCRLFPLDQVYFLGDFCKLSKTLSYGTCLGESPAGFCDVDCCFSTSGFSLIAFRRHHPSLFRELRRVFTHILYFQSSSSQIE